MECIDLAVQAPTGGGLPGLAWILIRDPETKRQIAEIHQRALASADSERRQADAGQHRMIEGGPLPDPAPRRGSGAGDPLRPGDA